MDFQFFMISSFLLWGPLRGPGLMRLSAQGLGRLTAAGCVRCAQGATGLWPEGCGIAIGHACGVRVDGPKGPKVLRVLKFDGPSARGLWYRPAGDEYICRLSAAAPPLAAKTIQPRLRRVEMHPFWCCAPLPPEGEVLAALCLEMLMSPEAEWRANLPLRGRRRRRRQKGCISIARQSGWLVFFRAKPGCMVFSPRLP